MMSARRSCPAILALLCLTSSAHAAAGPTPNDAAASRDTRASMCRAIVREMHIEIHKHKLRKNGEDDIYDTVPAICMAIVQNYTLTATAPPHRSFSLRKRAVKLDDDEDASSDPATFQHLVTLKNACEGFTEEFQQEMSELMYKAAMLSDIEPVVEEFCTSEAVATAPPPPPPPRKRKAAVAGSSGSSGGGGGGGGGKKEKAAKKKKAPKPGAEGETPDMMELLKK